MNRSFGHSERCIIAACLLAGVISAAPFSIGAVGDEYFHVRSIDELFVEIQKTGDSAPSIPSLWWIERVSLEQRRQAVSAQAFAGHLVDLLQAEVEAIRKTPTSELPDHAVRLVAIINWISTTDGYGNLLLAERAIDVLAVCVALAAYDESVDVVRLKVAVEKLGKGWLDSQVRARVLNADIGSDLLMGQSEDALFASWSRIAVAARSGEKVEGLPKGFIEAMCQSSPDGCAGAISKRLKANCHERIAMGFTTDNMRFATSMVLFRLAIGYFPTAAVRTGSNDGATSIVEDGSSSIVRPEKLHVDPQHSAFTQAWNKHLDARLASGDSIGSEQYEIVAFAWEGFRRVRDGEFVEAEPTSSR